MPPTLRPARALADRAMPALLAPARFQAKLTLNQPGDIYEQEADHVAAEVVGSTPPTSLPRKCACGGTPGPDGECAACRAKRLGLQRRAPEEGALSEVPPIVHDVLQSPGQPLDPATRAFMEPPFGHDFSQVRVHADTTAGRSASAVSAEAYTVGQHIVFASGRYSTGTLEGRRLLTHELVHTIQQGNIAIAAPTQITNALDTSEQEADAVADRVLRSGNATEAGTPLRLTNDHGIVAGTANGTWIARKQKKWPRWHETARKKIQAFAGPSDGKSAVRKWPDLAAYLCTLSESEAESLYWRLKSGDQFARYMKNKFKHKYFSALSVLNQLRKGNQSSACEPKAREDSDPETEEPAREDSDQETEEPADDCICGPDITAETERAVTKIEMEFHTWSDESKADHCKALHSSDTASFAWDINELHNQQWIKRYRPSCATACPKETDKPCGRFAPEEAKNANAAVGSVQIGSECHYPGSVNYVMWGVTHKLCYDFLIEGEEDVRKRLEFAAEFEPSPTGIELALAMRSGEFSKEVMKGIIWYYKGPGPFGEGSPNYEASVKWAEAGYDGWPSASSPSGDRSHCNPSCPIEYGTAPLPQDGSADPSIGTREFGIHWVPSPTSKAKEGWF